MMKALEKQDVERELLSQLLRSGAGIAANLSEAVYGSRRRDFFSNPRIALKEYSGTHARPKLLRATGSLTETESSSVNQDSTEIPKMLISINKPTQQAQMDSYQLSPLNFNSCTPSAWTAARLMCAPWLWMNKAPLWGRPHSRTPRYPARKIRNFTSGMPTGFSDRYPNVP